MSDFVGFAIFFGVCLFVIGYAYIAADQMRDL